MLQAKGVSVGHKSQLFYYLAFEFYKWLFHFRRLVLVNLSLINLDLIILNLYYFFDVLGVNRM